MPKFVIYKGPEQNVGRWGMIKPGTPLVLTDHEWECVKGNPDFAYNKNPEVPSDDPNVARQNEPGIVEALELREKSTTELWAFVDQLEKDGIKVECHRNAPKAHVIRAIELATKHADDKESPADVGSLPDDGDTSDGKIKRDAAREEFRHTLSEKTKAELTAYIEANGLELPARATKDALIDVIIAEWDIQNGVLEDGSQDESDKSPTAADREIALQQLTSASRDRLLEILAEGRASGAECPPDTATNDEIIAFLMAEWDKQKP